MARLNDLLFEVRCKRSAIERIEQELATARKAYDAAEAETVAAMRRLGLSAVHDIGDLWQLVGDRLSCSSVPDAYTVTLPAYPAGDPMDDDLHDDLAVATIPVAAGRVS